MFVVGFIASPEIKHIAMVSDPVSVDSAVVHHDIHKAAEKAKVIWLVGRMRSRPTKNDKN